MSRTRESGLAFIPGDDPDAILTYVQSFWQKSSPRRSGRERSLRFLALSGCELKPSGIVRITGTNGKGTTAVRVEAACRNAGRDTVCVTSPHTYSVRERIRLNGVPISWTQLGRLVGEMVPTLETMRGSLWHPRPTDIWVWAAFVLQATAAPRTEGIYEVGLGGASDHVNVFSRGVVGLTNLGTDHLDQFGGSRRALLAEKLGLCAQGDTLCCPSLGGDLDREVQRFCAAAGVRLLETRPARWSGEPQDGIDLRDAANSALAWDIVQAMGIPREGEIWESVLPARMEVRQVAGTRCVLDGAHNREAMRRLVSWLSDRPLRRTIIFGVQRHKQWRSLLDEVRELPCAPTVYCVEATTGDPVDAAELADYGRCRGLESHKIVGMSSAIARALSDDSKELVVTGSFTLFRDFNVAMHRLGHGACAVPLADIDPGRPWMRRLA